MMTQVITSAHTLQVPHGLANSLMLPHVLRYTGQMAEASELYRSVSPWLPWSLYSLCRQLTPLMFPHLVSTRGPGVSVMADGCAQLAQDLGIPTSLSQLGIQVRDHLIIKGCMCVCVCVDPSS